MALLAANRATHRRNSTRGRHITSVRPDSFERIVFCRPMRFFDRYQVWLHILGWIGLICLPFLTLPDSFWNRQDLISLGTAQLATSTFIIICFYLNLHILTPALLQENRTQWYLLPVVGMLIAVVLIRIGLYSIFPPAPMGAPPFDMNGPPMPPPNWALDSKVLQAPTPRPHSPWPSALGSAFSLVFALMVSAMMALFRHHTRSQETQQQMVLEKVSAELAMLKLQVSPHFLFNTLNNIRWLARRKSDQTEAAVVTLAQLLRYMLYQAQQDSVPLRKEVQHLQDYIDLQKMRLTDLHTVTFHHTGDIDAHPIEPLLFIPFVENAFKYGIHGQQPGHIHIALAVTDDTLTFVTENPAPPAGEPSTAEPDPGSGIGVANVRKRLALHYAHRHEITLTNENGLFRVALTLHLHHDTHALPGH